MKGGIQGFRLRSAKRKASSDCPGVGAATAQACKSDEALSRLLPKIVELAPQLDSMSEENFGAWVDTLPFDEFIEWIGLGAEAIGGIIRDARQQPRR